MLNGQFWYFGGYHPQFYRQVRSKRKIMFSYIISSRQAKWSDVNLYVSPICHLISVLERVILSHLQKKRFCCVSTYIMAENDVIGELNEMIEF